MRTARLLALLALIAGTASAELAPPAPRRVPGELVVATSRALAPLVRRAAARTGARVRVLAVGSDVAMAELYTARADAAVIGREALDNEVKAYAWIYGHPPVATPLRPGSVAVPGLSPAPAVLVHRGNPLRSVSPRALRTAFRAGAPAPTWRMLGVGGPLADRPIHLVIPDAESGTGRYLRHALLADQVQFDWDRTTEIAAAAGDAARDRRIDAAVARDPLALGLGTALAGGRAAVVRVDGLAPGEPHYPFARTILLYAPSTPTGALGRLAEALKAPR